MTGYIHTRFTWALAMLLLAGCGQLPSRDSAHYNISGVVRAAQSVLGAPYHYGGANPAGFDCSGLVYYSFRQAGITVPRSIDELYATSLPVSREQMQPGDLLFFRLDTPKISHVGIYVGEGRFIHAPSSGKQVSYADLDSPYWQPRLRSTRRL